MFIKYFIYATLVLFCINTHAYIFKTSEIIKTLKSNGITSFEKLVDLNDVGKKIKAKTSLKTESDIINIANNNKCLTHITSPDGQFSGITVSDKYLNMLEEISEQLKCQLNINLCIPFFAENSSDDLTARNLSELEAIDIATIRNRPPTKPILAAQINKMDEVDIAIQDLKNKILLLEKNNFSVENIENILQSSIAFIWGKALNISGYANLKMKIKTMATIEARSKVKGSLDNFADKVASEIKNHEITKKLIKDISEEEARQAKSTVNRHRLQKVKNVFSNHKIRGLITKAGLSTNLLAAIGVSIAIEGHAYLQDYLNGENARGVAEFFEKCSGGKFRYTRAEFLAGWVPGDQFKYYDKYNVIHKNDSNNTDECSVYGHANLTKLENFTNFDINLVKDIIADPNICNYLERLSEEVSINNNNTPKLTCPLPEDIKNGHNKKSIKLDFHSHSLDRFATTFGNPIKIEYTLSDNNYIPHKIINNIGFTPKHYKAESFSFSELKLGSDIKPVFRNADETRRTQVFFSDRNRETKIYYKCKNGKQLYPGRENSTRDHTCKYSAQDSKSHRLKLYEFTSEKSYEEFFKGVDSSRSYKKLKAKEKQFSDYSKTTLVRSRQLNRTIVEAGYCCQLIETDQFINMDSDEKSKHFQFNVCKDKYGLTYHTNSSSTIQSSGN